MDKTRYIIKTTNGIHNYYYKGGASGFYWTMDESLAYKFDFMTSATRHAIMELGLTEFSIEAV